ncbi:MAG: hypothetical protein LBM26_03380, partial [Methanobrevibacter sp.]|nr:hypothetical protein [Methanobrevibacter sp.]
MNINDINKDNTNILSKLKNIFIADNEKNNEIAIFKNLQSKSSNKSLYSSDKIANDKNNKSFQKQYLNRISNDNRFN